MSSVWSGATRSVMDESLAKDLVDLVNTARVTPSQLYTILIDYNLYMIASQMREVRAHIVTTSDRQRSAYEHVLCSRILDRWKLTEAFGVEGYYYHSHEFATTHDEPKDGFVPFISGDSE